MSLFIARQPILDTKQSTCAYELLFRSSLENSFGGADPEDACLRVFHDSVVEYGLESLVGVNKAFYNVTRDSLLNERYSVLPKEKVVLELLETIEPDAEVIAACERAKLAGYELALDDFVFEPKFDPLLDIVDVVKVDYLDTTPEARALLADQFSGRSLRLLAEKVETELEYFEARELGYDYFQGYFFCRPEVLPRDELPQFKAHYLQFLQEIQQSMLDLDGLERLIRQDVSLSVKLLRLLNSAAFGLSREIVSIKHALMLLGEKRIRQWGSVIALAGLGDDQPSELVVTGVVRAQFCELLADKVGMADQEFELFLLGMMSVVDALARQTMESVLSEIALPSPVEAALLGEPNELHGILALAIDYERGAWNEIEVRSKHYGLSADVVMNCYVGALAVANEIFDNTGLAAA